MKSGKYTITVVKASRAMALRRSALVLAARKSWDGKPTETDEDALMRYDETNLYPSLIACSIGKLPDTFKKFCDMPDEDVDKWLSEAVEINPHWFPIESSLAQEQVEQKKEIQPTASTND